MKIILVTAFFVALWGNISSAAPEVVCGNANRMKPSGFPYVASIQRVTIKKKHRQVEVANVYRGKRLVYRQYVTRSQAKGGITYASLSDDFRLELPAQGDGETLAGFRAILRTRGGDTMVSDGQFPCRKQDKI